MNLKLVNRYLLLRIQAETELEMLQGQMEPYVDVFLEKIAFGGKMKKRDVSEMDKLGVKINDYRTNVQFFDSQINSSGLYDLVEETGEFYTQKFNLN